MKKHSIFSFLLLCLFSLAASVEAFPQFTPLAYWQFEGPGTSDASGNNHPLVINPTFLNIQSNGSNVAGTYHHASPIPQHSPGALSTLDLGSTMEEITLEFWFRSSPGMRIGSIHWDAKCQFEIADDHIIWVIDLENGQGQLALNVSLGGVGAADAHNLLDTEWHHIVGQFDACSGEQKIYIDGLCHPGFTKHHTPAGRRLKDGGDFYVTYNGGVNLMSADLDEMAVYDEIIPPQLVWQHYNEGLAHNHYTFTVQPAYAGPVPFPQPTVQTGTNPLEFAPNYPNVTQTPIELFERYPLPRYTPNEQIRRLIPWVSDTDPFQYGSVATSNVDARRIFNHLAQEWNYYLFGASAQLNYLGTINNRLNDPQHYSSQVVLAFNDGANTNIPRFMMTNWAHVIVNNFTPVTFSSNFVQHDRPFSIFSGANTLPDDYFLRDAGGVPNPISGAGFCKTYAMAPNLTDPRLLTLGIDGETSNFYISTFFNNTAAQITSKHLSLIGENDETIGIRTWSEVYEDHEVVADRIASGISGKRYMSTRRNTMREEYRSPILASVDLMNAGASKPDVELYWYNNQGEDTIYQYGRTICKFNDGLSRPGPYWYPQSAHRWRHGVNDLFGIDQMSKARVFELAAGDEMCIPSISPGYTDQNQFVLDANMVRPGQFLGVLKGMQMMGAESFALFDYNANLLAPHEANWRIWKPAMPAYAQAIQGRLKEFLYNGVALHGDRSVLYHGSDATFLNFSTGNDQDFVTGRKLNLQEKYVIAASAQRQSNAISQGPHVKDISFRLHDNQNNTVFIEMVIEARLQGSTYYLDNTNPSTPIFYQLDKWHEWKEPTHWCRDFDFEAEVWDSLSAPAVATIHTDLRPGAPVGDFVGFTSYTTLASTSDWMRYYFRPTGNDQQTLYVWVRARNNTGNPENITVNVDGLNPKQMTIPASGNWEWIGLDISNASVMYTSLTNSQHFLELRVGHTSLEIDQVTLKRLPDDFSASTSGVTATGNDVCLGNPTIFIGTANQPAGCIDYLWDFGDGGRAYDLNTTHTYQYPGEYTVTFSATHQCLGTTVSTTIVVHVNAPYVEAGPDQLVCAGGNDHFQPVVFGASNPRWSVNSLVNLPNVGTVNPATGPGALNPLVTPIQSGYYYFTADSGGCSMTDSAWVTVLPALNVTASANQTVCPGQPTQLQVTGAFHVWWDSHSSLSSTAIANPIATPTMTTTYTWYGSDACRCDTVSGTITITVTGITSNQISACLGDVVTLSANGGTSYLWAPGGETTQSISVTVNSTQTYFVTISSPLCGTVVDQITVFLDNQPPTAICQNITVQLDNGGLASTTAAAIDNGSTDACGILSLILSQSNFSCANIGSNLTTLTVTDINGNTSTCTSLITVQDNLLPSALCQNLNLQLDAMGVVLANVDNGSFDNCANLTLMPTNLILNCSNVGINTITLVATDAGGNTSTCNATVIIQDNQPPVVQCQNAIVTLDLTGNAMLPPTIIDNGSSDNCPLVMNVNPGNVTCANIGANTVVLTATDPSGNTGTCTAIVTVVDNEAPIAHCQPVTVSLDALGNGAITPALVNDNSFDNCGNITFGLSNSQFNCTNVTTTNAVVLTVTDGSGNTSTCSAIVTVQDLVPPVAICRNVTVMLDPAGNATVNPNQVDNGSTDACGIGKLALSQMTFNCANLGANTVTLIVRDVNNNASTCTATVMVLDLLQPSAVC